MLKGKHRKNCGFIDKFFHLLLFASLKNGNDACFKRNRDYSIFCCNFCRCLINGCGSCDRVKRISQKQGLRVIATQSDVDFTVRLTDSRNQDTAACTQIAY